MGIEVFKGIFIFGGNWGRRYLIFLGMGRRYGEKLEDVGGIGS